MYNLVTMIKRTYWVNLIEQALARRSILWIRGVRRAGKTFLCRSFPGIIYLDCELPDIRRRLSDESFLHDNSGKFLAVDEIHRLDNPSQLLKIAADHFPETKIIATGSSLLETIKKFSDTLTGRKNTLYLTPATMHDTEEFGIKSIEERMLRGGLPPFLLDEAPKKSDYTEWLDSYWAKDIVGLFRLEKRDAFMKMMEIIFNESGGMFDASRYAAKCELSRQTVKGYLSIMEATAVVNVIRPFSGNNTNEIVSMPKTYGFDTGFIAFIKNWDSLRRDDYGLMWEHLVLNELAAVMQDGRIYYWRDKQQHEIDFIIKGGRNEVHAIECKWQSSQFDASNLKIFRKYHPKGINYVVSHDIKEPVTMEKTGMKIQYIGIKDIIRMQDGKIKGNNKYPEVTGQDYNLSEDPAFGMWKKQKKSVKKMVKDLRKPRFKKWGKNTKQKVGAGS